MLRTFSLLCGAAYSHQLAQVAPTSVSVAEAEAEAEGYYGSGYKSGYNKCGCCPPKTLSAKQIGCALYDLDDRVCDLQDCIDDLKEESADDCRVVIYDVVSAAGSVIENQDFGGDFDPETTIQEVYDAMVAFYAGQGITVNDCNDWFFGLQYNYISATTGSPIKASDIPAIGVDTKEGNLRSLKKSWGLCPDQDVVFSFELDASCSP